MADIIDRAGQDSDMLLEAGITAARRHRRTLLPVGTCHYCEELLPKVGQLFCNSECTEDHEMEQAARARMGRVDTD